MLYRLMLLALCCTGATGCGLFASHKDEHVLKTGVFHPRPSKDDAIRRAASKDPFPAAGQPMTQPAASAGNSSGGSD